MSRRTRYQRMPWRVANADLGVLNADATLQATLRRGQPSTADLVDTYRIHNRPIRDLLVRYLDERRPSIDFSSFRQLVTTLAGTFWADIEQHTPDIDTIDLPNDVATTAGLTGFEPGPLTPASFLQTCVLRPQLRGHLTQACQLLRYWKIVHATQ